MSPELFDVLSLAARYLFVFLGMLIVLHAFFWIVSDHFDRNRRLHTLPDAGIVGEFVVQGSPSLPSGTVIPVPWEGTLGRLRTCDIILPDAEIRPHHLSFSFERGQGLLLHLFSGCDAYLDGKIIDCRSAESESAMQHGSCLQIGSVCLLFRIFSGLNPMIMKASDENLSQYPDRGQSDWNRIPSIAQKQENAEMLPPVANAFPSQQNYNAEESVLPHVYAHTAEASVPLSSSQPSRSDQLNSSAAVLPSGQEASIHHPVQESAVKPLRHRRSERWEADWSE